MVSASLPLGDPHPAGTESTSERVAEVDRARAGVRTARAAWRLMADEGIADEVRCNAALDLAHAARLAGDVARFTQEKRAVLRLAGQADFPALAAEMAEMWRDLGRTPMERAS